MDLKKLPFLDDKQKLGFSCLYIEDKWKDFGQSCVILEEWNSWYLEIIFDNN